jgi:dimethylglycine dehydrogenase
MLVLAAGIAPAPAEARDLLVLRSELRRGELLGCDATACRLDKDTIPRQRIVMIGLGDPPLPMPQIRNPSHDELHLRDGSVRAGPLESLDARRVITPERTYERREVRWIYLAPRPAGVSGGGSGGGGSGRGGSGDGTSGFWMGTVGRRGVFRHSDPSSRGTLVTRTVRTVYTVRLRESPRSGDLGLDLDEATVRERLREVVSDSAGGGNRTEGAGTSRIDGGISDGLLVLGAPSRPSSYRFNIGTADDRYPSTTHWSSAASTHQQELFTGIWVGADPDPEQPRVLDASGRMMKGEYAVAHDYGGGDRLTESVSWELTRASAPATRSSAPVAADRERAAGRRRAMTETARVAVIGGGIMGASLLYHLARAGWTDIVLIERGELASGSTWHAAGNTPHFNTSLNLSRIHLASTELYQRLEAETGQAVGFHRPGSLRLASVPDRMDEYLRHRGKARTIGVPFEVIGPDEIRRLHPLVETHGLLGAVWNPEDGHVDPTSVTQALVKGALDLGACVHRHTRVTALERTPGGEWRIVTDRGDILAEAVVNAAGTWAREIGQLTGLDLPIVPMEHQYLVTEAIPEVAALGRELPLLREVDVSYYLRQEAQGLLLGPYERAARPFGVGGIPPGFGADLLPPDPERLRSIVEAAMARVPALARAGVQRIVNGPITYTPDGNPLLGPAFGLPGYWLACGLSFGITQAGGLGRYLAEWIVEGQPSIDLWELDPRRYGAYATERYAVARCIDIYEDEYAIVYPQDDRRLGGWPRPATTASRRRRRVRRPNGWSGRTGSRRPGRSPATGRASAGRTGSTRSAGRRAPSASTRACLSCQASRSTRSGDRARKPCSAACARTGCPASAGSPSPSCSTRTAPSSAT